MFSLIKRLKFSYAVYNFFHRKSLEHNIELYKELGLSKKYFSPVSSKDFKKFNDRLTKKDETKASEFINSDFFYQLSEASQNSIKTFDETGYTILRNYFNHQTIDSVNDDIRHLLESKKIKFKYGNKLMFALKQSELIRRIGLDKGLNKILDFLIKGEAVLFQSINFLSGSEQASHSDSIHMTTFPLGGLLGVWIALEDISEENGPVHYFPGSHKLPYYLNADYENEGNQIMIGNKSYQAYEDMMRKKIQELNLKKKVFTAKKGDVLIWHANLFHGGEPHLDKNKTRKSLVFHYFKKGVICYHEISQRPALIDKFI